MKQTVNVNLGGMVFHVDEDAYQDLDNYLSEIMQRLDSESAQEIMQDIEARIAELFDQHKKYSHIDVVTLGMVQDVKKQLGSAEEIGGEETAHPQREKKTNADERHEEDDVQEAEVIDSKQNEKADPKQATCKKKLYLDVDNATFGGVCAGLAQWMGIDTIWVRLVMAILFFVNGIGLLTYLLLWIIIPAANTAARRLEMQGIAPSVEAIKTEVENHPEKYANGTNGTTNNNGGCLVASGCLIALLLILGLPIIFALFVVFTTLGAVGSALNAAMLGLPFEMLQGSLLGVVSGVAFVLVPVVILIVWLVRRRNSNTPLKKTFLIVMLILWLLSLIGLAWGSQQAIQSASVMDWNKLEQRLDSVGSLLEQRLDTTGLLEVMEVLDEPFQEEQSLENMECGEGVLEVTEE